MQETDTQEVYSEEPGQSLSARRERTSIIAQAKAHELKQRWSDLNLDPAFNYLRPPETGLVSLRGRIGGGGAPFPFGDATATRTSIKLDTGEVGHAIVLGRDSQRATIAAVIDALCCVPDFAVRIEQQVIDPLRQSVQLDDRRRAEETAATKVDFFTMVRGDN